jgi:hypothetical protein
MIEEANKWKEKGFMSFVLKTFEIGSGLNSVTCLLIKVTLARVGICRRLPQAFCLLGPHSFRDLSCRHALPLISHLYQ